MASISQASAGGWAGRQDVDELVAGFDRLVSLPDIYYRLENAIDQPGASHETIAELLGQDPDLCARMLGMANSAFYSFPTRIETLERALAVIGLRRVRELVLVTVVARTFDGIAEESANMSDFWEHSVATGILARDLGLRVRARNADSFYVPGLLHDIGRLLMYLRFAADMQALLDQADATGQRLFALEQERFGFTHADVGARLLASWKVPRSIREPVQWHHLPDLGGEFAFATCAVHIADAWVHARRAAHRPRPAFDDNALALIDLDDQQLDDLGTDALLRTSATARQFAGH